VEVIAQEHQIGIIALSSTGAISVLFIRKQGIKREAIGLFTSAPWYANLIGIANGLIWAVISCFSLSSMDPGADVAALWLRFNPLRIAMMLIGPIRACLEYFFIRGFLMNQLKEAKVPGFAQALLSAFVFALNHSVWMIPIIGVYFLYGFFGSFFYGLLLAGLYSLGKRSLTPVMLSHGITVLVGEPILTYVLLGSFMF